MSQFDEVRQRFLGRGVTAENIDYAIDSVKNGTKREYILENLTADYRGMTHDEAVPLVEALYVANGGEFKKENRSGYLFGGTALVTGLLLSLYIISAVFHAGYRAAVLWRIVIPAILLLSVGVRLLWKAMRGKYRDTDEPWKA
jgi:hypothetical protein